MSHKHAADDDVNGQGMRKKPIDTLEPYLIHKNIESGAADGSNFVEGTVFQIFPRMKKCRLKLQRPQGGHPAQMIDVISDPFMETLNWSVGDKLQLALDGGELKCVESPAANVLPLEITFNQSIIGRYVLKVGQQAENGSLFRKSTRKKPKHKNAAALIRSAQTTDEMDWFGTPDLASDSDAQTAIASHNSPSTGSRSPTVAPSSRAPSRAISKEPSAPLSAKPPSIVSISPVPAKASRPPETEGQHGKRRASPHPDARPAKVIHMYAPNLNAAPDAATVSTAVSAEQGSLPRKMSKRQKLRAKAKGLTSHDQDPQSIGPAAAPGPALEPDDEEVNISAVIRGETALPLRTLTQDAGTTDHVKPGPAVLEGPHKSALTVTEETPVPVMMAQNDQDPDLNMTPGLRIPGDTQYVPLSQLKLRTMSSIIAVVTSARDVTRTSTGNWSRTLVLIDPSNLDNHGGILYIEGSGMKINMFTPKYTEWLPMPRVGDILLARMVKIDEHNGNKMGVGYGNAMCWAVFDPSTGQASHKDLGSVPRAERCNDGNGRLFSPFWSASPAELQYCKRLARWWEAVQRARRERFGDHEHVQIGDEGTAHNVSHAPTKAGQAKRIHRLISDLDIDDPARRWFDCTVEVLHSHANKQPDIHSIYVTDYTHLDGTPSYHENWCPAGLEEKVLRVETWKAAADLGRSMKPGEYWLLKNLRIKMARDGYLEGTFSEANKALHLDEGHTETIPTFRSFLQRKRAWEENSQGLDQFPHRLLSEVKTREYFDCTVEILNAVHERIGTTIWVTDYTKRADLPEAPLASWAHNLEGLVVPIELRDGQRDTAKQLKAGMFIVIKHLRLLEKSSTDGKAVGQLKGNDRLILKLNAKESSNEHLAALLLRKEQRELGEAAKPAIVPRTTVSPSRRGFSTIKDILESTRCPHRFRVHARIIDFGPALRLKDSIIRYCESCQERIPTELMACAHCNDTDRSLVRHSFLLFFELEDDSSPQSIRVAVSESSLCLADLDPAELIDDPDLENTLSGRLQPYLGNLVERHEGKLREVDVPMQASSADLTVVSWIIPGSEPEERGYALAS